MRHGFLTLTFRDDGDGTGKLSAQAEAQGYSGKSGAYFGIDRIAEFAQAISEFPLPDTSRCSLASGFWSKETSGALEQEHLGIHVYAVDHRGHIGVQVRMAREIWKDTRPRSQKTAMLEIITTYEPLARFSKDIVAIINGSAAEATLPGDALP
jgi:hypothetical protein